MADPPKRPQDEKDYMPPMAAAPPEAIMDPEDLAKMRDALRSGRNAVMGVHGHVMISHDPVGPPMTPEAERFIESKLGLARDLVQKGVNVQFEPDGSIKGTSDNQAVKWLASPDRKLDSEEIEFIRAGLRDGARVGIQPDGSIYVVKFPNDEPRHRFEAGELWEKLDAMIQSGDLQRRLDAGETVRVIERTLESDVLKVNDPTGFEFPEPPAPPQPDAVPPEPTTAAEMSERADDLWQEAVELRAQKIKSFTEDETRRGAERDSEARKQWGAEQEAKAADQQVKRETRLANEARGRAEAAERDAAALEAKGDTVNAELAREAAQGGRAMEATSAARAKLASEEAAKLRAEAAEHGRNVEHLEEAYNKIGAAAVAAEKAADALEDQSRYLRSASKHTAEADRLDAEATKLGAEGDAEAARLVQNAADAERKLGETDAGRARDLVAPQVDDVVAPEASSSGPVTKPSEVFDDDPLGPTPRAVVDDASDVDDVVAAVDTIDGSGPAVTASEDLLSPDTIADAAAPALAEAATPVDDTFDDFAPELEPEATGDDGWSDDPDSLA